MSLESILNLPVETPPEPEKKKLEIIEYVPKEEIKTGDRAEDDFEYVRKSLKEVIDNGIKALNNMANIADQLQDSRDYRVVGELIGSLSDATEKLYNLHKTKGEISTLTGKKSNNTEINVDKAVFVGSATDLLDILEKDKSDD